MHSAHNSHPLTSTCTRHGVPTDISVPHLAHLIPANFSGTVDSNINLVEPRGVEPLTSSMPWMRSPN